MSANKIENVLKQIISTQPGRVKDTLFELLTGAILSPAGFITSAISSITRSKSWTTYYKLIEKGKVNWVELCLQFFRFLLSSRKMETVNLIIDDTTVCRSSRKAPCSQYHHQHGNKKNRPKYLLGQCWVSLAISLGKRFSPIATPLMSELMDDTTEGGKIEIAKSLLTRVTNVLQYKTTNILVDCWFMKASFIKHAISLKMNVIGQIRRDARIYAAPIQKKKQRGRPKKYGERVLLKNIWRRKTNVKEMEIYGKKQEVRYVSGLYQARFLGDGLVRVVWVSLKNRDGSWGMTKILLCTNCETSPEDVISLYAERWSIEPMFNELKNNFGLNETWQQKKKTVQRWFNMKSLSFAVLQTAVSEIKPPNMKEYFPWRTKGRLTPGLLQSCFRVNKSMLAYLLPNSKVPNIHFPEINGNQEVNEQMQAPPNLK